MSSNRDLGLPRGVPDAERRVRMSKVLWKVVGYPPLSEMGDRQRREFQEALLDVDSFEDLPRTWQAAILNAEENRPKLWLVSGA
jgi:hypothetical protein